MKVFIVRGYDERAECMGWDGLGNVMIVRGGRGNEQGINC